MNMGRSEAVLTKAGRSEAAPVRRKRKAGVLMKKILVSMLVLALCAPAMAVGNVEVTDIDTTVAGQVTIELTSDTEIVGIGLLVDATAGQIDSFTVDSFFDIFLDVAWDMETNGGGYTYGAGAVADSNDGADPAGAGIVKLPTSDQFSISVGGLGGDEGTDPLVAAPQVAQIVLKAALGATVDIDVDTLRGGIVDYDGTQNIVGAGLPTTVVIAAAGPTECFSSAAGQKYTDWVAFGSPDCWCYQRQCRGDADGTSVGNSFTGIQWVLTNDLNIFLAAFGVYEPGGTLNSGPGILSVPNGICADFDHTGVGNSFTGIQRVLTNDLNIFLASFGVYEPGGTLNSGPGVPVCPLTTSGGDIVFYTN